MRMCMYAGAYALKEMANKTSPKRLTDFLFSFFSFTVALFRRE